MKYEGVPGAIGTKKKGEKRRKEKPVHILFLVGKSYIHIEAWKVKKTKSEAFMGIL